MTIHVVSPGETVDSIAAKYGVAPKQLAADNDLPPGLALAVGQSRAKRILIPVNHCDNIVVGVADLNMGGLIQEAVERILALREA